MVQTTTHQSVVGQSWLCHVDEQSSFSSNQIDWLAARTRPRAEKSVYHYCRNYGIPAFLPLEQRIRRYPGKGYQTSEIPLLTSYIFAASDRRERLYASGQVIDLLIPSAQETFRQELRSLISLLSLPGTGLTLRPELVPGTLVQITSGALGGCKGVVTRRKGSTQVSVNLVTMGTSVTAEIYADALEVVDEV